MSTRRTHTVSVQGQDKTVELEELRWLVAQLAGADGKATKVTVHFDRGAGQMDPGSVSLTANVPDSVRPTVNFR